MSVISTCTSSGRRMYPPALIGAPALTLPSTSCGSRRWSAATTCGYFSLYFGSRRARCGMTAALASPSFTAWHHGFWHFSLATRLRQGNTRRVARHNTHQKKDQSRHTVYSQNAEEHALDHIIPHRLPAPLSFALLLSTAPQHHVSIMPSGIPISRAQHLVSHGVNSSPVVNDCEQAWQADDSPAKLAGQLAVRSTSTCSGRPTRPLPG